MPQISRDEIARAELAKPELIIPEIDIDIDTAASGLDAEHASHFQLAVRNILATAAAQDVYAQILDGLPTIETWEAYLIPMRSHPIYKLNHTVACEIAVEKMTEYARTFDACTQLQFRRKLLSAFNAAPVGGPAFDLRLIEMTAVACHSIAAHLFKIDDPDLHSRELHRDWFASKKQIQILSGKFHVMLPRTPFIHRSYAACVQYPDGEADMVGYWAECAILGGVVVFDRGESENECNAVYFHDSRNRGGPMTLYPPTDDQLRDLLAFLKSPTGAPNPLPILASKLNRYRWDPYYAMKDHHIFRDRYERYNSESHRSTWRWSATHWPEKDDEWLLMWDAVQRAEGKPGADPESIRAAVQGLTMVTVTSPLYSSKGRGRWKCGDNA